MVRLMRTVGLVEPTPAPVAEEKKTEPKPKKTTKKSK